MLFQVAAGLVVLGLVVWLIGMLLEYPGVAVIGGVVLIIAGSGVALTNLEVRTGETRQFSYQLENSGNDYVKNETRITQTYSTTSLGDLLNVGMLAPLGLGGLLMLLGGVLTAHALDEFTT